MSRARALPCGLLALTAACGLPANRIDDPALAVAATLPTSQATPVQNGNAYDPTSTDPTKPPCPPAGGNELDVGVPCTHEGSECDKLKAVFCTATFTPLQPPYCTRSCTTEADCGTGAKCMTSPTNKKTFWCVPEGCVPQGYDTTATGPGLAACLPATGNSLGLGRPCPTQGICSNQKKTVQLCTTTAVPQAPLKMCTTICKVDADCGEDMTCGPAPSASTLRVCLPNACLP